MNKIMKYLLLALVPVFSMAQAQTTNTGAYVTDGSGVVVKSGFGACWRTSSWTPQLATKECDPDLFKEDMLPKKAEVIKTPEVIPHKVVKAVEPVTVVLKAFFDFNKSELNAVNEEKVKTIAKQIKAFNIEVITVTGNADRIGTEEYNQNLSEKRANVVKAALVNLGVEESRIYIESKGESQPVVNCPGKTTAKVIACLAPNRRVNIEVIGSNK